MIYETKLKTTLQGFVGAEIKNYDRTAVSASITKVIQEGVTTHLDVFILWFVRKAFVAYEIPVCMKMNIYKVLLKIIDEGYIESFFQKVFGVREGDVIEMTPYISTIARSAILKYRKNLGEYKNEFWIRSAKYLLTNNNPDSTKLIYDDFITLVEIANFECYVVGKKNIRTLRAMLKNEDTSELVVFTEHSMRRNFVQLKGDMYI